MSKKWGALFPKAERSKADFLLDGERTFESIHAALETAKESGHYIYILGWMLDLDVPLVRGDPQSTLINRLTEAASKGAEIRILVWDNPSPPGDYRRKLESAIDRINKLSNAKVFGDDNTYFPPQSKAVLSKLQPYVARLLNYFMGQFRPEAAPEALKIRVGGMELGFAVMVLLDLVTRQTIGAHHEKVTIVKGKSGLIAFCGGIDYNRNRIQATVGKVVKHFSWYHDTACRLQGPAAHEALEKFKLRWRNHPQASAIALTGANEPRPKPSPQPYPFATIVGTYNSPDGREKLRTFRSAYLAIIDAASRYIYIEDQYLVSLEIAEHLNRKIKENGFERVMFVIQDSHETSDIMIPNRKRGEFIQKVIEGANAAQREKVLLTLMDKQFWERDGYHPGVHAKTLIVDDEIAMIGSGNVNRRSLTCDSETSVVVFSDDGMKDQSFARVFRVATWREFMRSAPGSVNFRDWRTYMSELAQGGTTFAKITKYQRDSKDDLDVTLKSYFPTYVAGSLVLGRTPDPTLRAEIDRVFETAWQHLIEPDAGI
jgi:phosphatidylserine/phosphatidylglycerophosphate/cardiolipin synthase-like enzyme